ncbi:lipoprotein [Arenicella chitinivorans]|uniref:Lipoprotein n=1 Tax=Arenicella chitinivorans TaxID=1329800 RepID=A0A918RKN8_9GAMM|nr:DUF4156 domain-containing protein [Arenicella chitinivorans]GHA03116.1 lipoprotein [Arenicella chitinivorans]
MKNLTTLFILLTLSACASTVLEPAASMVRLTHTEPNPENCQFLGDITGAEDNIFISSEELETGARHDLKNKAYAMGGNVVYLLTQRSAQSGIFYDDFGSQDQTSVVLSGNVYKCSRQS